MGEAENRLAAEIARDLQLTLEGCVVEITTQVTDALTAATPMDTGWASLNWIPTVGEPAFAHPSNELAAESREVRADLAMEAAAAQSEGLQQIAYSYRLEQGDVYITDHVPYLEKLDAGSSAQAPAGFVEATIEVGVAAAVANFKIVEGL